MCLCVCVCVCFFRQSLFNALHPSPLAVCSLRIHTRTRTKASCVRRASNTHIPHRVPSSNPSLAGPVLLLFFSSLARLFLVHWNLRLEVHSPSCLSRPTLCPSPNYIISAPPLPPSHSSARGLLLVSLKQAPATAFSLSLSYALDTTTVFTQRLALSCYVCCALLPTIESTLEATQYGKCALLCFLQLCLPSSCRSLASSSLHIASPLCQARVLVRAVSCALFPCFYALHLISMHVCG